MNNIEIKIGSAIPQKQLLALYNAVGWSAYTNECNKDKLKTAVQNSTYVASAWYNEELIGLARVMSDDVSIFYLQDILVEPNYQRKGVGRMLLNNCLERFEHVRTKVLLTDDNKQQLDFYTSLGFENTRHLKNIILNTFVQMNGIELE